MITLNYNIKAAHMMTQLEVLTMCRLKPLFAEQLSLSHYGCTVS